jgi:hypothetical protein
MRLPVLWFLSVEFFQKRCCHFTDSYLALPAAVVEAHDTNKINASRWRGDMVLGRLLRCARDNAHARSSAGLQICRVCFTTHTANNKQTIKKICCVCDSVCYTIYLNLYFSLCVTRVCLYALFQGLKAEAHNSPPQRERAAQPLVCEQKVPGAGVCLCV